MNKKIWSSHSESVADGHTHTHERRLMDLEDAADSLGCDAVGELFYLFVLLHTALTIMAVH